DPATAADLARAEKAIRAPLPRQLAAFYQRAEGGEDGHLELFDIDTFVDVNRRRDRELRFAVFFGSDGGPGFFFVDPYNRMKPGQGRVFRHDRRSPRASASRFCGADLVEFLHRIARGERFESGKTLHLQHRDASIAALLAGLEATRGRWRGPAGKPFDDVFAA